MRHLLSLAAVVAVLLCAAVSARADGAADAKALLDKAIKARGGADNLAKVKAGTMTMKGKFQGMDYTATLAIQGTDQQRLEVSAGDVKFTRVLNKGKGWTALNNNVTELDKETVAELREELHASAVASLNPASLKEAKLSSLGEVKVNDKPALGVLVESKGYRDVSLYFDKETHLLVKSERRGKDVQTGGGEFGDETFYSDFKDVGGVKSPYKIIVHHDGKVFNEVELTEYKHVDKIDEAQFGKP